jgi:hypothetical protein
LHSDALRCWRQAAKLDPASPVPAFFLAQLQQALAEDRAMSPVSYNYQLPFQEQLKQWKNNASSFTAEVRNNPLLRASFFWALRYGDSGTRMQVTEALRWIEDEEMSEVLGELLQQEPLQEEKLQEAALISLQRLIGSSLKENPVSAEDQELAQGDLPSSTEKV